MSARRAIVGLVLLLTVVVPALGVAGDDHSASHRGAHREAGLRHQPLRPWRTVPAAVDSSVTVQPTAPLAGLEATEPEPALLLLVRTPFVPPRA
jgi:hypothetical protein